MDYTRTPGPQLSLNYHSALWDEGQQAVGVDSEGDRVKEQGGRKKKKARDEKVRDSYCGWSRVFI